MDDFDVFLNHRGPDVKADFVADLHEALQSAGLNAFLDKKSLVKGDPAFVSIHAALKVARLHVAVVSRGYAESKYCLSELEAMLRSGKRVIPVFYGVEPAELRWLDKGQFATAFEKHKLRETEEQVEEWVDALQKLADITGFCLSDYKGDETTLKQAIMDAILNLTTTNERLQVERHVVGLEEHLNTCINKLEEMSDDKGLLCIVGMGGIGKTSLAKEIFNHMVGRKKYQAMSFLEIDRNLSSSMEVGSSLLSRLQKQLLWDLLRVPNNNLQSYKYWFDKLSSRGPVLIVLDDVYNKSVFDMLIHDKTLLSLDSIIIVTSCDRHLLKMIVGESSFYLHEVTPLGCDNSEKLFNWHAFGNEEAPENFKTLAHGVITACGGLPLAIKVVGSSLFDKRSIEDQECIWPEAIDALRRNFDVKSALKWSFNCLTKSEKLMFVDIACVFYGWRKDEALEIWKSCKECSSCCASGTPYTSLRHLIDKSLVELKRTAWGDVLAMHGLLRDIGEGIGKIDGSHLWNSGASKAIERNNKRSKKVRALNLAKSQKRKFETKNFAKMSNLHFLVLDGCYVSGNFGSIWEELRWLQWRHMPMTHLPPILNLSNLISLDFSQSTKLANTWTEADPALEACPNLLRLNLSGCTSITTLPNSIRHLSRLKVLDLNKCGNLQKLPSSIGQLTALEELILWRCGSLEALPDTITALSGLQVLYMEGYSSISKLPTTYGPMAGLSEVSVDLATEWQAVAIGELNELQKLVVTQCTDEVITTLDSLGTLGNLEQLSDFWFNNCASITKLPKTIGLLSNLYYLQLYGCEKLQELPSSIGQLRMLNQLDLRKCGSLESLPDSLGAFTSLQYLWIGQCTSLTRLPTSVGFLPSLRVLRIEGCSELQPLPDSIRHLDALWLLIIMDCDICLEGVGALRVLQGLRIWGCTSITELQGSCLMVVDSTLLNPDWFYEYLEAVFYPVRPNLKEVRLLKEDDCGFLRLVQDISTQNGRLILQRVYKSSCCELKY